ncbi:hypothetical protein ACLUX0_01650 [Limosilactobacillus mucosae]
MEKVGILLVSIVLAALIVWKLVLPDYHKKKYVRMVLWSIFALGLVSAGIQGPTPADKKAASSSSAQSSSKAKSSSKKESSAKTSSNKKESSTKASSSKKKTDSINTKLMESLTEDQGFANGTLDENGNPTQNGTKNPQYNWATHVQKILWKDNGIEVYIYDAENLTESQLTTVAQSAQSAATATLLTEEKISDKESIQGIHTTVYSGNNVIGHSKVFSPKEFKWAK